MLVGFTPSSVLWRLDPACQSRASPIGLVRGWGGKPLCSGPDTDLKKRTADGAKLLSETMASFDPHQGPLNP